MSVIIETSIGDFTVDLLIDERPRCCLNFLKLCKIKYYNFSLFYSVQSNLVAQTGDPTATGRGGDSIYAKLYGEQARFFDMEVSPRIKHSRKGLISMVNNGSDMHGSQFFMTLADSLDYLDGKHTVFGEVAEGFDVIDKLNNTFCGEDNRPHQDIRIYHTIILDDPFDDPAGLVIPAMSPGPTEEMLKSDHIPCDADIDEDKDKTETELTEIQEEKEAKANTQILEMVGDLPSADVAPPENVLFVCKLNPVTTSDDLEIIFSRFGKINNCDVIKDNKTGESLQYAFIEFDNPDSCENAYFKMDNVLIDDRRIHVDFSQSVSKLKWKGKGKGVDILGTGDAPVYVLKNQERRDNNYDLVYEEDISNIGSSAKKNKHKKGNREQRSSSPHKKDRGGVGGAKDKERNYSHRDTKENSVYDRSKTERQHNVKTDSRKEKDTIGSRRRDSSDSDGNVRKRNRKRISSGEDETRDEKERRTDNGKRGKTEESGRRRDSEVHSRRNEEKVNYRDRSFEDQRQRVSSRDDNRSRDYRHESRQDRRHEERVRDSDPSRRHEERVRDSDPSLRHEERVRDSDPSRRHEERVRDSDPSRRKDYSSQRDSNRSEDRRYDISSKRERSASLEHISRSNKGRKQNAQTGGTDSDSSYEGASKEKKKKKGKKEIISESDNESKKHKKKKSKKHKKNVSDSSDSERDVQKKKKKSKHR